MNKTVALILDELNNKGLVSLVPKGNSMLPFFRSKRQSVIIAKKTERLKVYDAALYRREDDTLILHRVISVLPDGYVFVGDNTTEQESVPEENVLGVVCGFFKNKKYVSADDKSYVKRVQKWYKNEKTRRRKSKLIYFRLHLAEKIKRVFGLGKNND